MKNAIRAIAAAALIQTVALAGGIRGPLWATVPAGFSDSVYVTGLSAPVAMAFAPDGRLFVCQKNGDLRVITAAGTLLPTPFMTQAVETGGERGLLGIAFDPQFTTNNYLYVYYTVTGASIRNRVSRFTVNGDGVLPGSELPLMDMDPAPSMFHNGGSLHFGTDGTLFIAVGDGGPSPNAQMITNRFGKILRVNTDGTIPGDNPASFPGIMGSTTGLNRAIWAVGLRNPFTFAVQPVTGRMFINDVGNATWEEVNDGISGQNYGWPTTEGDFNSGTYPSFRRPIHFYTHDGVAQDPALGECITGSVFYPAGGSFPASYHGKYFYGDLTNRWIRLLDPADNSTTLFASNVNQPLDLDVGPDGALYYIEYAGGAAGAGRIGRIQYTAVGTPPSIATPPADQTVPVGQSAFFSVSAGGTAPLAYQWERDGLTLAGETASSYTLSNAQLADSGAQFRCVVTSAFGTATSAAATLTVTTNQPPAAAITSPGAGSTYAAGDTIAYAGTGNDPEDGAMAGSAFTWRVDFHHGTHTHPFMPDTTGATGGTFTIPTLGETSADVWYRITLTLQDSGGLTTTVTRDVFPVTANVTVVTNPPGLEVLIDGQPMTAPQTFLGVVGLTRTLGVNSPQGSWVFGSWSDGGLQSHAIATLATDTTYTVTMTASAPAPADSSSSKSSCGLLGLEGIVLTLLLLLRRASARYNGRP